MAKENRPRQAIIEEQKRRRLILGAVGGFFIVYFIFSFIFGDSGLLSYLRMKEMQQQLSNEIEQLHQKNAVLREEVRSLRSDPEYIEQIARDQLGMAKDGETIYKFDDTP